MHIVSRKALKEFWERFPDAEAALQAWFHEARVAEWEISAELKEKYRSASIINAERVVFNIRGNKYRLVVRINYTSKTLFIRFVGPHSEYDGNDAETV